MITRKQFLTSTSLGILSVPLLEKINISNTFANPLSITNSTSDIDCFRGNTTHTFYGTGPVSDHPKVVWKYHMGTFVSPVTQKAWKGTGWTGTAVVHGNTVYIGSLDSYFYAFDKYTGKRLWKYHAGAMFKSSACFYKDRLYIGNVDDHIHCINSKTGKGIWKYDTGLDCDSSPCIYNGKLYVAGEAGWMHCINPFDGQLVWRTFLNGQEGKPGSGGVETSPAIWNNKVYVANYTGYLFALSSSDGSLIWKAKTGDDTDVSPVIYDGKVYVAAEEKSPYVFCFDANTGKKLWQFGGYFTNGFWSTPAVANDKVYIGSNTGTMYCLNAQTGKVIWKTKVKKSIWSSPALVDNKLIFGSYDAHLYILDANTGKIISSIFTGRRVLSSPVVSNGYIYVGTAGGTFYCFK